MDEEKLLLKVDSNLEEFAAAAVEAKQELTTLIEKHIALVKSGKATAEQEELSAAAVRSAKKEYANATKTLDKMTASQQANATSYDGLYAQWAAAERKLKSLEGTIVKNADGTYTLSDSYKVAAKEVADAKAALNQFTTAANDGRNNVGLYGQAIEESFGQLKGQLGGIGPGFDALLQGLNLTKAGFVSLKGAIMATGIGALVILLVSLFQYFTKSKDGANFLRAATAGLGAAFDTLMAVIRPLGKWIVSIFEDPKKAAKDLVDFIKNQVIARFQGLGTILKGIGKILKGDFSEGAKTIAEGADQVKATVDELRNKVKKLAEEARAAAKAAYELAQAQTALEQANIDATYTLADLTKQAEKYKQIADDATRTMEERTAAAAKADRLEQQIYARKVQLATEAYRISKLELEQQRKLGNDTLEVQKKAAEAYSALREAQTAYTTALNDNGKRAREIALDSLELSLDSIEKGFDALKASNLQAIGDDKKTVAERRVILEALTRTRNETLAKEISLLQKHTAKIIDLADLAGSKDSVELDKKIRRLGLAEKATIRLQDVVKNQIDTTSEFADVQKTLDEKALARKQAFTAKEKELIDAVTNKNRDALNERASKELEISAATQTNLARKQIKNADELSLTLQQIETTKNIALRNIALESTRQAALDAEEQRSIKAKQDIEALQLEEGQKAQLLLDAEALNQANLAAIQQSYNLQKQENAAATEAEITANQKLNVELRKKALQGSLQVASDVFGTMSELVGKQTAIGKAFAITQAIINTYSSAVAAYNSAAQIPFVGYVLGPIAAGAAIAAGLKNVQAIKSASSSGGGSAAASGGGGSVISSSFTAASPAAAQSIAANSQQGLVSGAQQSANGAQQSGNATDEALKNNPPVLVIETFESKRDEYNRVKTGGDF